MTDTHIHSQFSLDSKMPIVDACEAAMQLGLSGICFTDHLDYDYPGYDDQFFVDFEDYFHQLGALRTQFPELSIGIGIEVGIQPHVLEKTQAVVSNYPFEYVISSVHILENMDIGLPDYYQERSHQEACTQYLKEILFSIKAFSDFDVLGHIDYMRRYLPTYKVEQSESACQTGGIVCRTDGSDCQIDGPDCQIGRSQASEQRTMLYADHSDIMDEILHILIQNDKGLEWNTAGIRKNIEPKFTDIQIYKRYLELGGDKITLGSDAHSAEYIGSGFPESVELLKSIGVRYLTHYQNRKPVLEKI